MLSLKRKRLPDVVEGGNEITDVHKQEQEHHGKKKRLSHSYFHLIVNTNQRANAYSTELDHMCRQLQKVSDPLLRQATVGNYIKFLKPGHSWTDEYIKKVFTLGRTERGEKYDQVHGHYMICIDHVSSVRLDLDKIHKLFTEGLGLPNVKLKVTIFPANRDPMQVLKDYLNKNMKGE